jgi:galactitol-specific phosphotransferase system IIB component
MKININAPLKYHLNLHLHDDYLDEESIIFEIIRFCLNQNKEDSDQLDLKFTSKTLKYVFGDKIKSDYFKDLMINSIKDHIKSGKIQVSGKSMSLNKETILKYYQEQ